MQKNSSWDVHYSSSLPHKTIEPCTSVTQQNAMETRKAVVGINRRQVYAVMPL